MAAKRLLLVEDDRALADLVAFHFERAGYDVTRTGDGEEALILVDEVRPDVVLLDWMIEGISGIEVCRRLRRRATTANVPIMMLTARGEESDRIRGLATGADDYITKPFDSEVLLLKIKAILKRNEELNRESENLEFDLGRYHFNPKLRELAHDGKTQTLSPKENELLKMLAEHKNDLLPRERALKKIWGSDTYFNGRSMDVYIAKLRKYLKDDENIEIVNIHGNGFRLVAP